jgi:GntR family transcriptional regulator
MPAEEIHRQRRRRSNEAYRVKDLLRVHIVNMLRESERLPSEPELALEYGVGRNVIREVLDLLRAEGLIERVRGAGTFVVRTPIDHEFDQFHPISDNIAAGATMRGQIRSRRFMVAPRAVQEQLRLEPGASCAMLDLTVSVKGRALSLMTSYVAADIGERLTASDFNGNFLSFLRSAGVEVGTAMMSVEASVADPTVADLMNVPPGQPLLLFHRRLFAADGAPLEFGFVRMRGDGMVLRVKLPAAVT